MRMSTAHIAPIAVKERKVSLSASCKVDNIIRQLFVPMLSMPTPERTSFLAEDVDDQLLRQVAQERPSVLASEIAFVDYMVLLYRKFQRESGGVLDSVSDASSMPADALDRDGDGDECNGDSRNQPNLSNRRRIYSRSGSRSASANASKYNSNNGTSDRSRDECEEKPGDDRQPGGESRKEQENEKNTTRRRSRKQSTSRSQKSTQNRQRAVQRNRMPSKDCPNADTDLQLKLQASVESRPELDRQAL
jgi:hypothetical protein